MSTTTESPPQLKRSITGRLLFTYVLGDVLGSGIYVLIGAVVATLTGLAYAELVTKFPRAAGAALYVSRAFRSPAVAFLVTICMLASTYAAAGSLATGFAGYFAEVWSAPPALLVSLVFVGLLALINFVGITESVLATMLMTVVEVAGLVIVLVVGVVHVARGNADVGVLADVTTEGSPVLAIVAGVALGFFAMTGFENAANVAEETVEPHRTFPRALVGGMVGAGLIYVAVAIAAALTVPIPTLAGSDAALLEVVESGILPLPVGVISIVFALIAMTAITNTTLVAVVTQSRILYGMAQEDVVPGVFARLHHQRRSPWVGLLFSVLVVAALLVTGTLVTGIGGGIDLVARLATVTVVLLLVVYCVVIVSALKLRGEGETAETFRAPTALLIAGLVGNLVLLAYVVWDDPASLLWCGGLVAVGLVLFVIQYGIGARGDADG